MRAANRSTVSPGATVTIFSDAEALPPDFLLWSCDGRWRPPAEGMVDVCVHPLGRKDEAVDAVPKRTA